MAWRGIGGLGLALGVLLPVAAGAQRLPAAPPSQAAATAAPATTPPRAVYDPDPQYTDAARRAHIEGTIRLSLTIQADGTVSDIKLLNHLGYGLDEQAAKTLAQWRFQPATRGGAAIAAPGVVVEMNFHLGRF